MFDFFFCKNIDFLIVGLGNPGGVYDFTRHNVGFMFLDSLENVGYKNKFNSLIKRISLFGKKVILVKPQTFMNLSGEAIAEIMRFYKLNIKQLIVIFDDIYLNFGKIRIKRNGSHGGHNGIKNIIENLNSTDFTRIKIGVDEPPFDIKLNDWVMVKFNKTEKDKLKDVFDYVKSSLELILTNKIDKAMSIYN
ncbi:MAG: aminoacyl-tRNA hydrolase [Candidatus Improbicoccus pseudotrichonymphae]|uniref:Peptidyl-tRNA hydrolase n=1 Tax=Candidatus Improbicoccus pseudotrichonymphae TaxID=3033792 RepID=A0AA48KYV5_9FIRM|nr:MAG: aminoacyl-tRNA hydrolase [Candidatus Improbicoccus pseudotrichonymphae]